MMVKMSKNPYIYIDLMVMMIYIRIILYKNETKIEEEYGLISLVFL